MLSLQETSAVWRTQSIWPISGHISVFCLKKKQPTEKPVWYWKASFGGPQNPGLIVKGKWLITSGTVSKHGNRKSPYAMGNSSIYQMGMFIGNCLYLCSWICCLGGLKNHPNSETSSLKCWVVNSEASPNPSHHLPRCLVSKTLKNH